MEAKSAGHYVFDGTWEGLLSTVFVVFEEKCAAITLVRSASEITDLFVPVREVVTDHARAGRVEHALKEKLGHRRVKELWSLLLAERKEADGTALAYIVRGFNLPVEEVDDPREPVVLELRDWRKKLRHEAHHMEAFVRFRENTDGIWSATIAPAYDVLPLITPHFRKRYADMRWCIRDERRGYGVYFDGRSIELVSTEAASAPAEQDAAYSTLWRTYFKHVDIPERRNKRLQMQRMPKRFWKHVLEMNG
ncbi:MAG TPA: TIGR03915 family putative DNA repair protein [Flavobacteriales bacterium]